MVYNTYKAIFGLSIHDMNPVAGGLRQAAASFAPEIRTTGQTIKVYAESGRLFEGKYLITYKK